MIAAADQKAWAKHYRRGWWAGVQRRDKQLDGLDEWQGTTYLTGYTAGEKAREQLDEGCKVDEYYRLPADEQQLCQTWDEVLPTLAEDEA